VPFFQYTSTIIYLMPFHVCRVYIHTVQWGERHLYDVNNRASLVYAGASVIHFSD